MLYSYFQAIFVIIIVIPLNKIFITSFPNVDASFQAMPNWEAWTQVSISTQTDWPKKKR